MSQNNLRSFYVNSVSHKESQIFILTSWQTKKKPNSTIQKMVLLYVAFSLTRPYYEFPLVMIKPICFNRSMFTHK